MSMRLLKGTGDPCKTGMTLTKADKESTIVEVEGPFNDLEGIDPYDYCPTGQVVENSTISPTVGGHGKLTIRCIDYGSGDVSTTPTRITWKIMMQEVDYKLENHDHFDEEARRQIAFWKATDDSKRYDNQGNPQYVDSEGTEHPLTSPATDYVTAYEKGIETYRRHFPVIEKISYYKTLPGCSMNKNSTTSGHVNQFSGDIDTWSVPDVTLKGFDDDGWFKSGDNYEQGNDLVWTRVEQWTWTPDGSGSDTGWIYDNSDS